MPGHIESIVRYANFERRQSPKDLSAAEIVYASQLEVESVDETTQMAIVTLYAKFLWQAKKDVEAARAVFKTGEGKFDSRFYFSNYLKFEMSQEGKGNAAAECSMQPHPFADIQGLFFFSMSIR